MIDINELRRLLDSRDMIDGVALHANLRSTITELLDRLEAAERAWKESNKACRDLTEKVIPNLRESLEAAERDRATFITEIGDLCTKVEAAEKERDDVAQQLVQAEIGKRKLDAERDALRVKIAEMERQEPVAFALYSGWALKSTYLKEHEACEQRDRRQLTADLGGSLEAYRVVPLYTLQGAKGEEK